MRDDPRVPLPFVYQVMKYDPADRDEHGRYRGPEDVRADHGPIEAAYLATVAAFAQDSGVSRFAIREPGLAWINFGVEPIIDGFGLTGLFAPDLTGFHDGALVPISVGLELVRAMLRDHGAWCRLEVDDRFFVHIGFDQYMYLGSAVACDAAVALAVEHGLFAERIGDSPYSVEVADYSTNPAARRPADPQWWAELASLAREHGTVLLEEGYVEGASRWHRVTAASIHRIRAGLAPRSRLLVWPDQSGDVDTVLADVRSNGLAEVVWERADGRLRSRIVDNTVSDLPVMIAGARRATSVPIRVDDRRPLLSGVLPDPDGILRARWAAE